MALCSAPLLPLLLTVLAHQAQAMNNVASGRGFSLFLDPITGKVAATGRNLYGQLGINSTEDQLSPVEVEMPGGERVIDVSAGAFHSLFLTQSGTVYATGRNNFGQLGDGTNTDRYLPVPSLLDLGSGEARRVIAVAAGYAHSLYLLYSHTVASTGLGTAGQLGSTSLENRNVPAMVHWPSEWGSCWPGWDNVLDIAAGYDFSYFLLGTQGSAPECHGNVYATGQGLAGQLGNGLRESSSTLVPVSISGVQAISAGESHGLFLKKDGSLHGTGSNFDGQVGSGELHTAAPAQIVDGEVVMDAFAGGDSSCFTQQNRQNETDTLFELGTYGLGSNRQGQLGLGEGAIFSSPANIELEDLAQAAIGESHSLFLVGSFGNLQVFAAGSNSYGQFGDGTESSSDEPRSVVQFVTTTRTFTSTAGHSSSTTTSSGTETSTRTTRVAPASTGTATATRTTTATRKAQDTAGGGASTLAWIWVGSVGVAIVGLLVLVLVQKERPTEVEGSDDEAELDQIELQGGER